MIRMEDEYRQDNMTDPEPGFVVPAMPYKWAKGGYITVTGVTTTTGTSITPGMKYVPTTSGSTTSPRASSILGSVKIDIEKIRRKIDRA